MKIQLPGAGRRFLGACALGALAVGTAASGASAAEPGAPATTTPDARPQVEAPACRPISFTNADVVRTDDGHRLVVSGSAPYANMEVRLVPATYVTRPTYWEISVVGCLPNGAGYPALRAYDTALDLRGTLGSRGVRVGDQTFDVRTRTSWWTFRRP